MVYLEINEGKDVSDVIAAGKVQAECTKQLEGMLQDWIGKKVCIFINHVYQKYTCQIIKLMEFYPLLCFVN